MTGRFVLLVIALCTVAYGWDKVPTWSAVAVVILALAAWSLVRLDRKWERERRRERLAPVEGRRR